jgi:hypothetical protein
MQYSILVRTLPNRPGTAPASNGSGIIWAMSSLASFKLIHKYIGKLLDLREHSFMRDKVILLHGLGENALWMVGIERP